MSTHEFSPIKSTQQLLEAINYTHFKCFELCKNNYGRYLPVAGNIGIFCHDDNEYKFLTKLRKELTKDSDNWNQKYYRLFKPIVIPSEGEVPKTVYTYLYIRKPDEHAEVGDVDFVMGAEQFDELKKSLQSGVEIKGIKLFDRPELDLLRVFDTNMDVLAFIGKRNMAENIQA